MEDAVVECVPNFSEGRDPEVLDALSAAVRGVPGVTLLDVSPGADTHRAVLTFAGAPGPVADAALAAAREAHARIDMRTHAGAHPRLGALDVCPVVPVRGVTLQQCADIARDLGRRLAEELDVPVYLYGAAVAAGAERDHRRTAAQIRAGEYEALPEKLKEAKWRPDFGPSEPRPRWGASMVGARPFLLAYNVNILGTKEQAHRIALNVREAGRGPDQPGRLRHVQGMGWWLEEKQIAQVSLNVLDCEATPLHEAFEAVVQEAAALRVGVAGSELVGLAPLAALAAAGRFYAQREGLLLLGEEELLALAVARLGLAQLAPFDPKERVLELRLGLHDTAGPIAAGSVRTFLRQLGARTTAPGGGSAAALTAAMGAALGRMVAQLTWGKRQFEGVEAEVRRLLPPIHDAARALEGAADADSRAFAQYVAALQLPRGDEAAGAARAEAMERALQGAAGAPLAALRLLTSLWAPLRALALVGSAAAACDLRVAAKLLEGAAWGLRFNVDANAALMADRAAAGTARAEAAAATAAAEEGAAALLRALDERPDTAVPSLDARK